MRKLIKILFLWDTLLNIWSAISYLMNPKTLNLMRFWFDSFLIKKRSPWMRILYVYKQTTEDKMILEQLMIIFQELHKSSVILMRKTEPKMLINVKSTESIRCISTFWYLFLVGGMQCAQHLKSRVEFGGIHYYYTSSSVGLLVDPVSSSAPFK